MKPSGNTGSYGLILNSPTGFLISFVLKNAGHAKLCSHTKGHSDNNNCYVQKLKGKLFLGFRLLVYKCLEMGVAEFFLKKKNAGNNKQIPPGCIYCCF